MSASRRAIAVVLTVLLLAAYAAATNRLGKAPRSGVQPELLVSMPRIAQILLAGGDRHLAANLSGFRVLVAATARMEAADYAVQARLQEDIAWLNPAHEDNYYIAAAFLPWNGHLDSAQYVLRRAESARQNDWLPDFYLGFHYFHFMKDPAEGARWLLAGVPRAREQSDQWALQNLAANWTEKGYSPSAAAGLVGAMAASAPAGAFRAYLQVRADRLKQLADLRKLAVIYKERNGRGLAKISELVEGGLIASLPIDPLGVGFSVDSEGMPVFKSSAMEH